MIKMENKIRLFFAGDFCSKPSTSQISVSNELRDLIQSCDLKVVNFEVPLKPDAVLPQSYFERFWQHDDAPKFLYEVGFNLFSLANNHIFDWGVEGFKKTKVALGEATFGAGTYDEAYKVKVVEINGKKIGFMALSYAAYTGTFDDVMHHDGLGCAYINDLRVNHDIIEAKKNTDYLFILPHDGIEFIDVPMPESIARYRDFIDYGADGVIASHPHCPQGWEEYKGKPIFYSLGNFFFNSKETSSFKANKPHWYEGLCVVMTITDGNLSWEVINTRNVDNVGIEIDQDEERNRHNEYLVSLLKNREKYEFVLKKECKRLVDIQEMPIVDEAMHPSSLKSYTKQALQNWIKIWKKQAISDDFRLCSLLRNDMRRNVLIRGIK